MSKRPLETVYKRLDDKGLYIITPCPNVFCDSSKKIVYETAYAEALLETRKTLLSQLHHHADIDEMLNTLNDLASEMQDIEGLFGLHHDKIISMYNFERYPECVFPIDELPSKETIARLMKNVDESATAVIREREVLTEKQYTEVPFRPATESDIIKAYNEICECAMKVIFQFLPGSSNSNIW